MAKLYFYYSAMNAGKTTTLLQSSYNYNERGLETLLYTPALDTRYKEGEITSRIGLKSKACIFDHLFNFFDEVKEKQALLTKLACILIDEAQFLTRNQVSQLTRIVDVLALPVLTYGLRTDFKGETFEGSQYLLALSDELVEIKTICFCGRKAIMNARIDHSGFTVQSGNQIEIGGNDRYVSLCRRHYHEARECSLTLPLI